MGRGHYSSGAHRGRGRQSNLSAREWVYLSDEPANLRVMSYNILSEVLQQENSYLYPCCSRSVLEWGNRFRAIKKEIETHQPDVLCLQEVDTRQQAAMQEALNHLGLEGFFCSRTAREHIKMKEHGLNDNAAQVACLRLSGVPTAPTVVVGNIHVLFNQKRGDVKLGQVRTLLDTMHRMGCAAGASVGIACGDFNSCAGSPLYRFCVEGSLDLRPHARERISGSLSDRNSSRGGRMGGMHYRGGMNHRGGYRGNHQHMPRNRGHHAYGSAQHYNHLQRNSHAHMGGQRGNFHPHSQPQHQHQQRQYHMDHAAHQHMHATSGRRGAPAHWEPQGQHSRTLESTPPMQQQHNAYNMQGGPDWASAESIPGHAERMIPEHSNTGRMHEGRGGYRGRRGGPGGPVPRTGGRHGQGRGQYVYGRQGRHMVGRDRGRGDSGTGDVDGQGLERFRGAGDHDFDWGQCNWSREALLAAFGREPENPVLQHPLSLQSAYNTVIGHEAPFTTCHSQGTKTVDFVMYTADVFSGGAADCTGGLRPVGVLQAPHPQSIARGLPTAELPSDHISLVADFVLYSGDRQSAPDAQKDGDPILVE